MMMTFLLSHVAAAAAAAAAAVLNGHDGEAVCIPRMNVSLLQPGLTDDMDYILKYMSCFHLVSRPSS
jgi:hypothetical protein